MIERPVAEIENDAAAARGCHVRKQSALVVEPFGAGAYMWVTMSPRLSSGRMARIGENDWPIWIITGRLKGAAAS